MHWDLFKKAFNIVIFRLEFFSCEVRTYADNDMNFKQRKKQFE